MMLGDTDITKDFQQETTKSVKNGLNKLHRVSYDVTLKNESFAITYKYSSKKLKCVAKIPRSGLPETSLQILLKLKECENCWIFASLRCFIVEQKKICG